MRLDVSSLAHMNLLAKYQFCINDFLYLHFQAVHVPYPSKLLSRFVWSRISLQKFSHHLLLSTYGELFRRFPINAGIMSPSESCHPIVSDCFLQQKLCASYCISQSVYHLCRSTEYQG